ncbi:hypothetical protein DFH06DRAFT_1129729 [Mycena polygramma]|nr:hypothetical protein DFH06DRAFT_1129729 [Mycena polygramma]
MSVVARLSSFNLNVNSSREDFFKLKLTILLPSNKTDLMADGRFCGSALRALEVRWQSSGSSGRYSRSIRERVSAMGDSLFFFTLASRVETTTRAIPDYQAHCGRFSRAYEPRDILCSVEHASTQMAEGRPWALLNRGIAAPLGLATRSAGIFGSFPRSSSAQDRVFLRSPPFFLVLFLPLQSQQSPQAEHAIPFGEGAARGERVGSEDSITDGRPERALAKRELRNDFLATGIVVEARAYTFSGWLFWVCVAPPPSHDSAEVNHPH